ncbi:MAG: TonB-dependent receptor, partial [Tannerellaceae bacterium]|nr:TonB-dependent receptor [Tannerellaceae bacterium]
MEVKGTVLEEGSKTPVEQATIRLLNVTDSTLINGVVSSRNGSFSLKNIAPGTYLLGITFIGFEPYYQPLQITGRTNPVDVGNIELGDASILLGEAVVVGKAAEVVVRNDTIEYNADSYKVTEGSVLEDLLKKMPGVEVSSQGTITVNGKEVKKIMVDGKEFFSDDPNVASKNLPAAMIDKLQVLDRKSDMTQMTGFDDGEEETVINLTVKPGMKQGWFGNAFAGYGSQDRYEGNAMVNRFINNDQITLMGGLNNTNNMGFTDLASTMFQGGGGGA